MSHLHLLTAAGTTAACRRSQREYPDRPTLPQVFFRRRVPQSREAGRRPGQPAGGGASCRRPREHRAAKPEQERENREEPLAENGLVHVNEVVVYAALLGHMSGTWVNCWNLLLWEVSVELPMAANVQVPEDSKSVLPATRFKNPVIFLCRTKHTGDSKYWSISLCFYLTSSSSYSVRRRV